MLRVEGFFESHAGTTLVLEPAATFDMSNGGEINNFGRIVELGSARLIRASSGLSFTDADGNIMNAIPAGGGIYIQVQDIDENSDGQALDQVFVTVENLVNGDREIATLTETARASGLFRSLPPGLPSAQAGVVPGDGIMQRSQTDALRAAYTDEQDPSDAGLAYLLGVAQRVIEYLLGIRNDPTGLDYNSDGKVDIGDAVHRIGN